MCATRSGRVPPAAGEEGLMRPTMARVVGVASFILTRLAAPAAHAADPKDFFFQCNVSGNISLKYALNLREEQGGITPGLSGTMWTIKPDGHWQMTYFRTVDGKEQTLPKP